MGRSCTRRSSALRVPDSGRRAGGTKLEHHSEQTRELPKSVRCISRGKDRPLWQTPRAALAAQRWHRSEPIEERGYDREREKISRVAKRIQNFRRLSLELCWRCANSESVANPR